MSKKNQIYEMDSAVYKIRLPLCWAGVLKTLAKERGITLQEVMRIAIKEKYGLVIFDGPEEIKKIYQKAMEGLNAKE